MFAGNVHYMHRSTQIQRFSDGVPCSSPRNLTLAGSCFSFSHVTATWFLARKACRDSGGDLATLSNNFTSSAVGQFLLNGRGCRDCSWWIGLTNARWVWPSGTCGRYIRFAIFCNECSQ